MLELFVLALQISWKFRFCSLELAIPECKIREGFSIIQPAKKLLTHSYCW